MFVAVYWIFRRQLFLLIAATGLLKATLGRAATGQCHCAVCGYLQHVLLTTNNEQMSNMFDRSNKLRARILAIENIRTRGMLLLSTKLLAMSKKSCPVSVATLQVPIIDDVSVRIGQCSLFYTHLSHATHKTVEKSSSFHKTKKLSIGTILVIRKRNVL
jgi:hypothetical protein